MGLINIPAIENLDEANEELWNSRFALIAAVINGNIESVNLKDFAVTEAKLANASVSAAKLQDNIVTARNANNLWVGPSTLKENVNTTHYETFNYSFDNPELCTLYVVYTSSANANTTSAQGNFKVYINDEVVRSLTGNQSLEIFQAKINRDYPFSITASKVSVPAGTTSVKIEAYSSSNSHTFDLYAGHVSIHALDDTHYLGS